MTEILSWLDLYTSYTTEGRKCVETYRLCTHYVRQQAPILFIHLHSLEKHSLQTLKQSAPRTYTCSRVCLQLSLMRLVLVQVVCRKKNV